MASVARGEQEHGHNAAYRPEIDGLRALAVLPVVLNHFAVPGFRGGYVGVDIFFVISGYLITSILARDLASDRYSIAHFYRRRVLRIFPALFAMLTATTLLACLLMTPGELVRYGRALIATAVFGSNLLFFTEAGYFDATSNLKPLLHTWSLAIEEQFYILWPLILAFIGARRMKGMIGVVAGITVASLAFACWQVPANPSAGFFLLPSRAWELGLGGLVALVRWRPAARWANELIAAAGLLAILGAIAAYDELTLFPGLAAMPPVLGAAAIIFTGRQTLAGRLLSLRPALLIGRISYSVYLWHWPLVVFVKIGWFAPLSLGLKAGLVAASILLGALSWRLVEEPFRGRRAAAWSTPAILTSAAGAMAVAIAAGLALLASHGLAARFIPAQVGLAAYADRPLEDHFRRGSCFLVEAEDQLDVGRCLTPRGGKPVVLLAGDSHSAHLWPGLSGLGDRYDLLQESVTGCRPLLNAIGVERCTQAMHALLGDWVKQNKPDLVILSGRWRPRDIPGLVETLAQLKADGVPALVVGPAPAYTAPLPRMMVWSELRKDPGLLARNADPIPPAIDAAMRQAALAGGADYLSLVDAFCVQGVCRTLATPTTPLQYDDSHFTLETSTIVAKLLQPKIAAAVERR